MRRLAIIAVLSLLSGCSAFIGPLSTTYPAYNPYPYQGYYPGPAAYSVVVGPPPPGYMVGHQHYPGCGHWGNQPYQGYGRNGVPYNGTPPPPPAAPGQPVNPAPTMGGQRGRGPAVAFPRRGR